MTPWWLLLLPAGTALLVLANLLFWPRGRRSGAPPQVSILIPARDEEPRIEATVRAALAAAPFEVIVCDDGSTDRTRELLANLDDPRLTVIEGGALPLGWVGKPHACHRLAGAARGEVLLFVDADTVLDRSALCRLGDLFHRYRADLVTAFPGQEMGSFAERLIVPLLHLTYLSWLFLPLIWRWKSPRFLAANGQLMAIRRAAYHRIGGFAEIRAELVDDMALARNAKRAGLVVLFADGHRIARCRMYTSWSEVSDGFAKNLYEGLGSSPLALAVVLLLYGAAFLVPFSLLPSGGVLTLIGALGVLANLIARAAIALRFRHAASSVLLHPLAVLALFAIAVRSVAWSRQGRIRWRGRVYAARAERARSALEGDHV